MPSLGRFKKVFSTEIEKELPASCRDLDKTFYRFTFKTLGSLVFKCAERNLDQRFNKDKKPVRKDWISSFCNQNHLNLQSSEKTRFACAADFNRPQEGLFF